MFIISLRLDQTVVIGTDTKVTLVGVRGKQVRLPKKSARPMVPVTAVRLVEPRSARSTL
jgi:Global regulator protein family